MTLTTMDWNLGWVQYTYLLLLLFKCLPKMRHTSKTEETAAFIEWFPWVAHAVPVFMIVVSFSILYLGGCFSYTYNWMLWAIIAHTLLRALLILSDKDFISKVKAQMFTLKDSHDSPTKVLYQQFTKLVFLFLAGFFTHSLPIPLF